MPCEYYDGYNHFLAKISNYKCISSREAEIFSNGEFVYKIYDYSFPIEYRGEKNIDEISKLNHRYVTVPLSKIYVGNEFLGIKMEYRGLSLDECIKKNQITYDELISALWQIKGIIEYLKSFNLCHTDINISNILWCGSVCLTDLNGMIYSSEKTINLNKLVDMWNKSVTSPLLLDELAFNYITYFIFNYDFDEIRTIIENCFLLRPKDLDYILSRDRKVFDTDMSDLLKASLKGDEGAIKALKPNTFLIDYLK